MTTSASDVAVYLETGNRRTFAGAVAWPGYCRSGRNEEAALASLLEYGRRYGQLLQAAGIDFQVPATVAEFTVVERLEGNATTDFGAPNIPLASDNRPVDEAELMHLQAVMKACWQAFDLAVERAQGKELRKGPRGGGRDLNPIVAHVLAADATYLAKLPWKFKKGVTGNTGQELERTRQAILDGVAAKARGELPSKGPRGGKVWDTGTFVRRVTWHVLDHLWEIEDRAQG